MSRARILSTLLLLASCGDDDANTRIDITDTQVEDTPDIAPDTDVTPLDVADDTAPDAPEVVRVNLPPVLTALPDLTIRVGRPVELTAAATDPNLPDDTLVFSLVAGPIGASIDASSGTFIWFPGAAQLGSHDVTLAVTDRGGARDEDTFAVQVIAPGSGPRLEPIADELIVPGDSLSVDVVAFDADLPEDQLSYSLALAPAGMVIDAAGKITWTPVEADLGRHDVTVEVHDSLFLSDSASFIVTVRLTNRGPVAVDDYYVTPRGVTTTVPPLGVHHNDLDPDGDTLTATLVTPPAHGTLDLRTDGSFDYRPGTPAGTPFEPVIGYRFISHPSNGLDCYSQGHAAVGDVDGDGRTEIIARCAFGAGAANGGWVVMLRANPATAELDMIWGTHTWGNGNPGGIDDDVDVMWSQPVLADLDGNGKLEIILPSLSQGHNVVLDHAGQLVSGPVAGAPGLIRRDDSGFRTVADLNGDGLPEILGVEYERVGAPPFPEVIAWDRMGTRLWDTRLTERTVEADEGIPIVVADLDLDGRPEMIVDRHVLDSDGEIRWFIPPVGEFGTRTFVVVANLDDDAFGEVVLTNPVRGVEVRHHDGTCLWRARPTPLDNTCPHRPGPSVSWSTGLAVADLNGDGEPEIVVSTFYDVFALDRDGAVVWSQTNVKVDDNAVQISDLMVFDFDGDGAMEVVVSGTPGNTSTTIFGGIKFLDGRDGTTLETLGSRGLVNPGRYQLKMLVADIDDNGSAELLVVDHISVNGAGSPTGLFVYKSGNLPWTNTRPVWNQWSYAVTNATTSGDVPAHPAVNWLTPGLNNFRVNVPLREEAGGSDHFTYTTSDGAVTSDEATVVLDIRRHNNPPVILGEAPDVVGAGFVYRHAIYVADADVGDSVTLTLERGPAGMTLVDGILYWPTVPADLGEHPVLVSARDLEGALDLLDFTLRVVTPVPVPDVIGLPRAAAEAAITSAGFLVGRVTEADHPTMPQGGVSDQHPQAPTLAAPGTAMTLVVSTGAGPADRDSDSDDFTPNQGDCNDDDADIFPGAVDLGDGIDQDCDGLDGTTLPVALVVDPETIDLLAGEARHLRVLARFADGSEQEVTSLATWQVQGAAVSVLPGGLVRAQQAGSATVTARRWELSATATVSVTGFDDTDDSPPVASLTSPSQGATVLGPVDILGFATDAGLVRWDLELAPAGPDGRPGPSDFQLLASGTEPVAGGSLGLLDATTRANGTYIVRLTVRDVGDNVSVDERTVVLDGEQKVGLFKLAFVDASVPMGSLALEVTRGYDSRDKTVGDFGVGWQMELTRIAIDCGGTLGEGWYVGKSGLTFELLPTRPHACTVTLPGGLTETFDLVPTPTVSPFVPFIFINTTLVPRVGVLGTLTSLGNTYVNVFDPQPGPVVLLDDSTLDPLAPTRFRYTTADGTAYVVGPDGLETVTDRQGNTLTFEAERIVHSNGAELVTERDTLGRITQLTDPSGAKQRYAYTASGDLAAHTDPLGHTMRFYYNRDHGLVRIEDPLGRSIVRTEFDARGRVIARVDAAGARTTHDYDDAERTMTTTYPDGTTRVTRYDARGNVVGEGGTVTIDGTTVAVESQLAYDEEGNVTLEVDADGVRTESVYADGQATLSVIDPDGLAITESHVFEDNKLMTSTDPSGRVTTYEYDARDNATGAVGSGGRRVELVYDGDGNVTRREDETTVTTVVRDNRGAVTELVTRDLAGALLRRVTSTYDEVGRLTSESVHGGPADEPGSSARVTRWEYDAAGRRTKRIDPAGGERRFEYDAAGQLVAMTDELGARTTFAYDTNGNPASTTYADGGRATYQHDFAGRVLRMVDVAGVETRYGYDELGRLISTHVDDVLVEARTLTPGGRLTATRDAAGNVTRFTLDSAGRPISATSSEVVDGRTGELVVPEVRFELDALGRRVALTDATGHTTRFTYDAAGNPASTTFADGTSVATVFDTAGRLVSKTDELGHVWQFDYDALGRLVAVDEPPASVGAAVATTRFSYDVFGDLRTRTDAEGKTMSFAYDARGRRTRTVFPSGGVQVDVYDLAGRAINRVHPDGVAVTTTFDVMGRPTRREAGALVDPLVETMTWNNRGQRIGTVDDRGETVLEYDTANRLSAVIEPDGTEVRYTFDDAGRLVEVAVDDVATTYTWDALGRLATVTRGGIEADHSYDPAGRLVRVELPGNVVETMSYDARSRPLVVAQHVGGTERGRFVSTYTARGERASLVTLDGSVETFTYDALGRLVAGARTGSAAFDVAYVYDLVGNRTRSTEGGVVTTYTYGANHELTSLTTGGVVRTFQHDARGRRISESGGGDDVTYTWNSFDQLVARTHGGDSTAWTYDADGRRVARTHLGETRRLVVDRLSVTGFDQVLEERASDGSVVAAFTYGQRLVGSEVGGELRTIGHDAHGSTRLAFDETGTVSDRLDYQPYGGELARTGISELTHGFAGERRDGDLYDLRARFYDSATGVFLSRDPHSGDARHPISLHPYQFADLDPVGNIDPTGHYTMPELSISMMIQGGQRLWNFVKTTAVRCQANSWAGILGLTVALADTAVLLYNIYNNGGVKVDVTQNLPNGGKLKVGFTPYIKEGCPGFKLELGLEVPERGNWTAGGAIGADIHRGKATSISGEAGVKYTVSACGVKVVALGLMGVLEDSTEKAGQFRIEGSIEFAQNREDDRLEGGAFLSGTLWQYP